MWFFRRILTNESSGADESATAFEIYLRQGTNSWLKCCGPAHGSAHEPSQNFFMFLFKIESLFDTLVFPNLQRKLPCLSSHESSQGVSYACFSIS